MIDEMYATDSWGFDRGTCERPSSATDDAKATEEEKVRKGPMQMEVCKHRNWMHHWVDGWWK